MVRPKHAKDGVAMVEFALLVPTLMLVLFGIIELGFLLSSYVAITNVAREGARVGVSYFTTSDDQRSLIVREAITSAYDASWRTPMGLAPNVGHLDEPNSIRVTYVPTDVTNVTRSGQPMTVTVRYSYDLTFGVVPQLPSMTFTGTSTMRIE